MVVKVVPIGTIEMETDMGVVPITMIMKMVMVIIIAGEIIMRTKGSAIQEKTKEDPLPHWFGIRSIL